MYLRHLRLQPCSPHLLAPTPRLSTRGVARNGSVLTTNNLEARTRLCQISLVLFGVVTLHPPTFSVFPIFSGLTTCSPGSVFTTALLSLSLSPKSHTTEAVALT
ncbi:hypothetical protein K449DRAFT_244428 [Hypoxylon sp. EC38]|nr:hypothetical protein K449DRAFT_244428 [Hypoxylon sp. EC38]